MTLTNLHKTPWPWFGGKSDAAPFAWEATGTAQHKERLWLSPGCLVTEKERPEQQQQLFGGAA